MADDADYDLSGLGVSKIKNAIIAHTNAPAVAIFELLAAVRERIVFKGKNRFRNARLYLRRQTGKLLPGVARDFNPPVHTLILSSFNA
jgi:hypothetical protein